MDSKIIVAIAILAVILVAAAFMTLSKPAEEQPTGTTTTLAQNATVNDSEIVSEVESEWVGESDDVEIGEMI